VFSWLLTISGGYMEAAGLNLAWALVIFYE